MKAIYVDLNFHGIECHGVQVFPEPDDGEDNFEENFETVTNMLGAILDNMKEP